MSSVAASIISLSFDTVDIVPGCEHASTSENTLRARAGLLFAVVGDEEAVGWHGTPDRLGNNAAPGGE